MKTTANDLPIEAMLAAPAGAESAMRGQARKHYRRSGYTKSGARNDWRPTPDKYRTQFRELRWFSYMMRIVEVW